jgi:pyrroloquinoline quinone biosynthesis protein D
LRFFPGRRIRGADTRQAMSIDRDSIPRIGRGFRLQWEAAQNAHVLLYPEGMVKLNGSAAEILNRCDGATPVAAIVADLERCFSTSGLDADVLAFLEMAHGQRWVAFA